jgi:pimeloyl-ACP methyl ester carboxylesterase
MPPTEYASSADGTSIAFERHGDADVVVVLVEPPLHHRGFSAFGGLVPLLAEHFAVVTYDRRGRGQSGDADTYHPDREVEDLMAVIRDVGGVAGLYGYSAGALLALRVAASAGTSGAVNGLVVLEPPLHEDGDPRPDPLTLEIAELVTSDRAAAVRRFHEAIGVPEEYLDEMSHAPSWDRMLETAHTLVYDCTISDATDSGLLARVATPTLVLDSEGSSDDLTGWAAAVAEQLPNATGRSLHGEWHTVADEILAPVIIDHLTTNAARLQR